MVLIAVTEAYEWLVAYALENRPSLVIDCGNLCDPHKYFPAFDEEDLSEVYVMQVDLLYKFRDTCKYLLSYPACPRLVVVTSFHHLFSYNDDLENFKVVMHAFEFLRDLAEDRYVIVDVPKRYEWVARRFCEVTDWDTLFPLRETH